MRILILVLLLGLAVPAAAAPVTFGTSLDEWTIKLPRKAAHTRPSKHRHRFATRRWTLEVMPWPRSKIFVHELDQLIADRLQRDPAMIVVHVDERAAGDWSLVVKVGDELRGTVLRPGHHDDAMCTFTLAADATWAAPLAACDSIVPAS